MFKGAVPRRGCMRIEKLDHLAPEDLIVLFSPFMLRKR